MTGSLILFDTKSDYRINESAVIVAALAWVIVVGSTGLAAIIICGWKGAKDVVIDWRHAKATFTCR